MTEHQNDKLLNIKTSSEPVLYTNSHYHRYEPTPYSALEQLFEAYDLSWSDRVVDFGCGKGRLNFYIHYRFRASVVGIEMNEDLHDSAIYNYKNYQKKHRCGPGKIQFHCCLAEKYRIHPSDNCFYFFNPFSIQVFMTVIGNILRSYEEDPRTMDLVLYYPSDDYTYYLLNETPFKFIQEVTLDGLYEINPYERFSIYRLNV